MGYRQQASGVGPGLRALLAAMGGTPGRAGLQNLWDHWEEALGAELSALARPLGQHPGRQKNRPGKSDSAAHGAVLLLGAEDAMLLQELRFRGEEILARVNTFLGHAYFSEVEVSLPLGRNEPVRTRSVEKTLPDQKEVSEECPRPGGTFLAAMDPASPVARCYARFAGLKHGRDNQENDAEEREEKTEIAVH